MTFDFSGWATKNNLKCSDGRVIMQDAFKECDGKIVPLVWNHKHESPFTILGHALLKNVKDGVRAFATFNDTEQGQNAKMLVENGDISALSIYANQLQQAGTNVKHGVIREVSLVLAGANPGASIDTQSFAHGDDCGDEAVIYTGLPIELNLSHADSDEEEDKKEMADENKNKEEKGKTVQDVIDSMTEEQKNVMYALVGQALAGEADDDEEGEDEDMKHNVFDRNEEVRGGVLQHSDQEAILALAKKAGSFQDALEMYAEENGFDGLAHADTASPVGGFVQDTNTDGNVSWLFPEYKDVRPGAPELITNDQGWIGTVMSKVHKSPISRIRTSQVDIRNLDALRAKGYKKGNKKAVTGNFKLVRRTTDPQTVYVKNALHKDDITDITDFDYVQYLYNIDRMMLNEELATAIMLGDGRDDGDDNKISPDHIRPIWTDDDLYTIHRDLDTSNIQGTDTDSFFGQNYVTAEGMIQTLLYAREDYKGTGTPDLYITPHMLNVMLLARDRNGRRIFSSKGELASALNVGNIYTAEQFEGKTRTAGEGADAKTKKLLAMVVNLADYSLGSTKGGEISHFTQFDIDFNQEKSLIETRVSGALTRVYSAIVIEEDVTAEG